MAKITGGGGSGGGGSDDDNGSETSTSQSSTTDNSEMVRRLKQKLDRPVAETTTTTDTVSSKDQQTGTSDREAARKFKQETQNQQSEKTSASQGQSSSGSPTSSQQAPQAAERAVEQDQQQASGSDGGSKTSSQRKPQPRAAEAQAVRVDQRRQRSAETRGLRLAESRATNDGVEYAFSGSAPGKRTRKEFRTSPKGTQVKTLTLERRTGETKAGRGEKQPSPFSKVRERADENLSPIVGMALKEGDVETAKAGEQQLAERAAQGDFVAGVFQTGEEIQIAGQDARRVVEKKATKLFTPPEEGSASSGLADAKVGGGTVKEQVAGFAGGVVEFPALVGGGALQASAAAGEGADIALKGRADVEKTAGRFGSGFVAGGKKQVDFAADRPLEAGLILATPFAVRGAAAGGRAAGGRAKAGVERAAKSERAANLRQFAKSERGQAQLTGKAKGKTKSSETVENVGQVDPRSLGKGKPEGRSAGVEPTFGSRRGRSGLTGKRAYAERVRGTKEIEAKAPETDLRSVYDFSEPTAKSSGARAAAAGGPARGSEGQKLLEQAQKSSFEEDVTLERSSKSEAELFDVESRGQRQTQIQQLKRQQEQAQRSEVREKAAQTAGDLQDAASKVDVATRRKTRQSGDQAIGSRGKTRSRTRTVPDVAIGEKSTQRTRTATDQTTRQTADPVPTGDPGRDTDFNTPNRTPNRPPRVRPPGIPVPKFGGDRGGFGLGSQRRRTRIVRNPVASPEEFGEVGAKLGLSDSPSNDPPDIGRKEKKRKKGLYDIFDLDNL